MTLRETALLMSMLLRQTDSWLQAAIHDWDYPVTHEWMVAAHTYDLLAAVNSKNKPKPYPTPWRPAGTNKLGKANQSNATVLKHLEAMNPKE